jgi:hypothetical protein
MAMTNMKTDKLIASANKLRRTLAAESRDGNQAWAENVFSALGETASAVQEEVRTAEQSKESVGELNPDFEPMPVTERHVDSMRKQMIQLGEQLHQLRADLKQARDGKTVDTAPWRERGQQIADAIEKLRRDDDGYVLEKLNSNPGAGD